MNIPRYIIRTMQLIFILVCALPLQAFAETQVAACFQNPTRGATIAGDPVLTDILRQPNCIKIDSVELGAEVPISFTKSATADVGIGKFAFNSLTLKKIVDDASASLFINMATNSQYRQIIIYFIEENRSAGVVSVSNLTTWQLGKAFVTKINTIAESGLEESELRGTEAVTVVFGELRFTQGSRSVTWSQVTNSTTVDIAPLPR
jgi:hypothetical protein